MSSCASSITPVSAHLVRQAVFDTNHRVCNFPFLPVTTRHTLKSSIASPKRRWGAYCGSPHICTACMPTALPNIMPSTLYNHVHRTCMTLRPRAIRIVCLFYFFAQDSPACAGHDEPQSAHRACFRDRAVKAIPAASNAGDTEDAL